MQMMSFLPSASSSSQFQPSYNDCWCNLKNLLPHFEWKWSEIDIWKLFSISHTHYPITTNVCNGMSFPWRMRCMSKVFQQKHIILLFGISRSEWETISSQSQMLTLCRIQFTESFHPTQKLLLALSLKMPLPPHKGLESCVKNERTLINNYQKVLCSRNVHKNICKL